MTPSNNTNIGIKIFFFIWFFLPNIFFLIFLYCAWFSKEFNLGLIIIKCFLLTLIISIVVSIITRIIYTLYIAVENFLSVVIIFFYFCFFIWLLLIKSHFLTDLNQTFNFGIYTIIVIGMMIYAFFFF